MYIYKTSHNKYSSRRTNRIAVIHFLFFSGLDYEGQQFFKTFVYTSHVSLRIPPNAAPALSMKHNKHYVFQYLLIRI